MSAVWRLPLRRGRVPFRPHRRRFNGSSKSNVCAWYEQEPRSNFHDCVAVIDRLITPRGPIANC